MSYLVESLRKDLDRLKAMGVDAQSLMRAADRLEADDLRTEVMKNPESLGETLACIGRKVADDKMSAYATFNAVSNVYKGYIETLQNKLDTDMSTSEAEGVLIAAAKGEVSHVYNGLCPDKVEGLETRDNECRVCRALIRLEREG